MATHMKLLINLSDHNDVTAHAVNITRDDKGNITREEPAKEVVRQGDNITIEGLFAKGPIQLGVIYYTHNSPGCVYYIGNKKYELC